METLKSTHEAKRYIISELYKNGPETAEEVSKNSGLHLSTVYRNLNGPIVDLLNMKIKYTSKENGLFGKRFKVYSLKKEYAAGIKMCEDSGIDILNLVDYVKK